MNRLIFDTLSIHRGAKRVIADLCLSTTAQIIKISGKNGSGKTSFLLGVSGLIPISSGSINLLGESKKSSRRSMCGVFSSAILLPEYLTVNEILSACQAPISDQLKVFETEFLCNIHSCTRISGLSEGQKRKVAIVCALRKERGALLLDEPFNALDKVAMGVLVEYLSNYSGMLIYTSHSKVSFLAKETEITL
ncbi:ATP-binding cassette domain-containing protein [Microbulbifer variabilis]|uniref:ABC transporter ATP-binding protein n=1 Tax=Microbulbifer variabilis TaxID=266805 RepID=UPI001CFEE338|nr:ATP-binding cassette domain-containing protein [Microbulbifer variabilis]